MLTKHTICWIEIYPVDSFSHPLKTRDKHNLHVLGMYLGAVNGKSKHRRHAVIKICLACKRYLDNILFSQAVQFIFVAFMRKTCICECLLP